jgi:predicted transcriptional regulator
MLNEWYAKMGQLIHEFRDKYPQPEQSTQSVSVEN